METKTAEYGFQVDSLAPNIVEGIEKTGLEFGFLADLTLKTVYADADCSTERTAERLKLPMFVVEPILQHLYRERLIEIRQLVGFENHRYSILDRGWDRVQRLLDQRVRERVALFGARAASLHDQPGAKCGVEVVEYRGLGLP